MKMLSLLLGISAVLYSANELKRESTRVTQVIELATAGDINGLRALN